MTVQDVASEATLIGNGVTTSFPFSFRVDDLAWLTLSYLANFNMIVLNGDQDTAPGGTVEYFIAPPANQRIALTRVAPLTQLTDYTRHGPFDSEAHEDALDKLTMIVQDRDRQTARKSKSITIELPTNSEDLTMFFTPVGLTINELQAVIRGSSTPSISWTLRHGPDRSVAGTEVVTGGTTSTDVTTGDNITVLDSSVIPANSYVWLETTALSGTVNGLHITIRYTEDLP